MKWERDLQIHSLREMVTCMNFIILYHICVFISLMHLDFWSSALWINCSAFRNTMSLQFMCVFTVSFFFRCFYVGWREFKSTKWIFTLLATFCSKWHFSCSHMVTLNVLALSQHVISERMLVAQNYVSTVAWFRC